MGGQLDELLLSLATRCLVCYCLCFNVFCLLHEATNKYNWLIVSNFLKIKIITRIRKRSESSKYRQYSLLSTLTGISYRHVWYRGIWIPCITNKEVPNYVIWLSEVQDDLQPDWQTLQWTFWLIVDYQIHSRHVNGVFWTLWRPLLPYAYSYKASCIRPG